MRPGSEQVLNLRWRGLLVVATMILVLNFTAGATPAPAAPVAAPEAKKPGEPATAQPPPAAEKQIPAQKLGTKPKKGKASKEKKETPKLAPGQKVNLNTASQEELEKLPGVGRVKAQAIMKGRPYKSPEDIMKIRGIKEGTYQKLKEFISVK